MNFAEFIAEQKNTHMTHIEDKVLYGGVDGTRQAILALRSLRDMLGGVKDGNVSVKWDGAPAIFCGNDPRDGKFFVAKKGIFNATPKVYKNNADIDADTDGDLNLKLKNASDFVLTKEQKQRRNVTFNKDDLNYLKSLCHVLLQPV